MSDLIFGHTWDEIRRKQQGERVGRSVAPSDPVSMKAQIEKDMVMFGLPVHRTVQEAYGITIPENYELVGDTYRPKQN